MSGMKEPRLPATRPEVRALTPFQESCEHALRAALQAHGLTLAGREVEGAQETYVRAAVPEADMVVFINRREAVFGRAGLPARRYGLDTYISPLRLQNDFVRDLLEAVLAGGRRSSTESAAQGRHS